MPAAAKAMLEKSGIQEVGDIQKDILTAYSLDFSKHAPGKDIPRIAAIWNSIPSQLAKENRKFVYKLVKQGARAREYEDALLWLEHAGMIYRVFCSSRPGLPLCAYDDLSAFKVYMCDGGLLRVMSQLPVEVKSGTRLGGKSLGIYVDRFNSALALRYSMNNLRKDGVIINIPIFLADWTDKILRMAY